MGDVLDRRPLTVGILSPIGSMNPYDSLDFGCGMVQQQVYETLYRRVGSAVTPLLATQMPRPVAVDGRVRYAIPLRQDVRFSDGTPMTPADVIASLRFTRRFADARRLEASDEGIVVEFERPDMGLASALATPRTAITRQVQSTAGASHLDTRLGTGPWRMAPEFAPADARLIPNPFYRGERPQLADLRFVRFEPDAEGRPTALIEALESGEVDLTTMLATRDARKVQNARHIIRPGCSTALLWLNIERMEELRLRDAVCASVDRYGLAEKSYLHPERFVAQSVLPPGMHHRSDRYRYDREHARACIRACGAPKAPLRMLVIWGPRPYLPAPRHWASAIKEMLAASGLACELVRSTDALDYQSRIRAGEYDMVLGGWTADTEDPCDFVEALFDPVVIPSPDDVVATGCNFSRLDDSVVRSALGEYRETRSTEVLDELLGRAEELRCVLPLAYGPTIAVHGWHVAGFHTDALGVPDFSSLHLRA